MVAPSFVFGRHRVSPSPGYPCPGGGCAPGKVCCPDGVCRHPHQCASAMQSSPAIGYDDPTQPPDPTLAGLGALDDGAEGGAWWDMVCPDGQDFNVSTMKCEPSGGGPTTTDPPFPGEKCPDGYVGTPPVCWPMSLPATPPVQVPPDVPTVTEHECQARVAEADGRKWLFGGVAGVAGLALGFGASLLLR